MDEFTAYAKRSAQRPLIKDIHRSMSLCGIGTLPMQPGNAALFCDGESAVTGNMHCHSAWGCPVCSPELAASRVESLGPQITNLMLSGWSAWLLTLTVLHEKGDGLSHLLDGITEAWKGVTSGKAWARWRGYSESSAQFVRSFDVTHGRNGWHPHLHILLLLPPGRNDAQWLLDRWVSCLAYQGFKIQRDGLSCYQVYDAVAAAVFELTTPHKKQARSAGGERTPFEILSSSIVDYRARCVESKNISLWREYISATKGRRQTATSQGLKLKPDRYERKGGGIVENSVINECRNT